MIAFSTFSSPSGDEMVVMSRAEFDRLKGAAQDVADVRAYDQAKAALASGEEELIPAEMLDRMLAGESPVKVWRQHRGLTLAALAARTDLSEGYLSQIETGKRDGTVESFKRIAEALGLTVDDLI